MVVSSAIQSLSALLVKMTDGRVPIFEIVVCPVTTQSLL